MRKCVNGIYSDMTTEEIRAREEAMAGRQPPAPTAEEDIEELKRENAELRKMIEALASGEVGA